MENCQKKDLDMTMYSPGLVLGVVMFSLTAAGIYLSTSGRFPEISYGVLRVPAAILGWVLIVCAAAMWICAVTVSKERNAILSDELVITGVYSWVRNPIYSSIMFACTGALLIYGNAALLVFPPIMWAAITATVSGTEEKWLRVRFGRDFEDYCNRTNRCIPFPNGRKGA